MNETNNSNKHIEDAIFEIKLAQVKQEANQSRTNEILDRLTESVEIHVKRSDKLEELVELYKEQNEKALQPIKSHITFMKGMGAALLLTGSLIAALHGMGILQKLLV